MPASVAVTVTVTMSDAQQSTGFNALQLFDDVRAMIWRLLHTKP